MYATCKRLYTFGIYPDSCKPDIYMLNEIVRNTKKICYNVELPTPPPSLHQCILTTAYTTTTITAMMAITTGTWTKSNFVFWLLAAYYEYAVQKFIQAMLLSPNFFFPRGAAKKYLKKDQVNPEFEVS